MIIVFIKDLHNEDLFNYIYSILEEALKVVVINGVYTFSVQLDLLSVVTFRQGDNVISFYMDNGIVRDVWFNGEKCDFTPEKRVELTKLMKQL